MQHSFRAVKELIREGNGCTSQYGSLKAYIVPYGDNTCDVYIADQDTLVYETECKTNEVGYWCRKRRIQYEADLAITMRNGTAHIKKVGNASLDILLLSDADNIIAEERITEGFLYQWLHDHIDW